MVGAGGKVRVHDMAQHGTRPSPPGVQKGTAGVPKEPYARGGSNADCEKETAMLGTLIVVLVVLWLLGMVTSYTMGGLIHILLVVAIIVVLVRVIQGRNPLKG
jgi:hypothetical protein